MCNETHDVENSVNMMETAAEQLSMTQQNVNTPLFDLMFKLINYPQVGANIYGAKVKVLHTYAHRFLEFYMTECPDGVSIHTVCANDIHEIASKLRSFGDGLSRLLVYLGLDNENEQLIECVDSLAVAYDAFAVVMTKVEDTHDEFCCASCNCDCDDCNCCRCECSDENDENEDETTWVNEYREDDDSEEYDPEKEGNTPGDDNQENDDSVEHLFESLFGFTPRVVKSEAARQHEKTETTTAKNPAKEKVRDEELDELARLLTDAFFRAAGIPIPKNTRRQEVNKPKKPYEKPKVEVRTYTPAKRIVVREVMPGFWKFGV